MKVSTLHLGHYISVVASKCTVKNHAVNDVFKQTVNAIKGAVGDLGKC